jgi:hypothetical protein
VLSDAQVAPLKIEPVGEFVFHKRYAPPRNIDFDQESPLTADKRKFVQRIIKTGLPSDNFTGICEGLQIEEPMVTDGTLFVPSRNSTQLLMKVAIVNGRLFIRL